MSSGSFFLSNEEEQLLILSLGLGGGIRYSSRLDVHFAKGITSACKTEKSGWTQMRLVRVPSLVPAFSREETSGLENELRSMGENEG